MSKTRYGLLLLSFVFCTLQGQKNEIRFHHIGVDEGLSHSLVSSIAEDSLGFLWFGTQDGLNRYDGYQFKTFYKGESSREPSDSWIKHLYIDRHNQLWIWYTGQGLERFDPFTETFHRYETDPADSSSISSTSYVTTQSLNNTDFYEDSDGELWIATNRGLNRYDRDSDSFERFCKKPGDSGSLYSNEILVMAEDDRGFLWVGTTGGLCRMDRDTGTVRHYNALPGSDRHLNDGIIGTIHCHPDGTLWVGTARGGLNIIENPGAAEPYIHHLIENPLNPNHEPTVFDILRTSTGQMLVATNHGLYRVEKEGDGYREELYQETRGIRIYHMLEDSKGYVWVASSSFIGNSLFRLPPDLGSVRSFRYKEWDPYVFGGGKVQFLHESRTGLVWIGSEKEGVYMVDLNARPFRTIDNYPERGLYISDEEVYSIYEDGRSQLYIGTKNELNRIDLRTGSTHGFGNAYNLKRNVTYDYSNELPASLIGVIEPHHDGRIWLGAFDYKVSLYDPESGRFLNFHLNEADSTSFRLWSMRSICVTSSNDVYFGGTGSGLGRLLPGGLSFEYFPVVETGDPAGTNDSHIQYIYEDRQGILWLGTLNGGLNRFDPATGKFSHFVYDPSDTGSISNNRVKCILEPEIYDDGILWVGTNNGGLNRFDREGKRFTSYGMREGLPSNTIHGILEDKVGNLWMSTNRGLVRFDPVTGSVKVYTGEDGLAGNEFNEGAFFKNGEGRMYFGGTNGVTYFYPEEIRGNGAYEAPLVLTGFLLSGEPVLPGDTIHGRVVLDQSISFADEIVLTHKDRFIGFEFASLDFAASSKIRYRYMLEDFEDSWNEVDADHRYVSYTNIPNGTYRLTVMATNSEGDYTGNTTGITLQVLPPFWRTLWFKLTVVVAVTFILLLIIRLRTQMLKKQKQQLEMEVEERTRDLKEANRMLKKQKDEIQIMADRLHESDQMKLKFYTNISHEFRTPLTLIMGPTEKLMARVNYDDAEAVRRELELMHRNQRRLFKLINQLLEVRRVETGNLKLVVAEDDLVGYLRGIYKLFIPYAEKKTIDFSFEARPEKIGILFDADKLEKIFYNLLSNAFKHTPKNGRIVFSVGLVEDESGRWVRAAVRDSGPGISPEHIPHIFDRFYQITNKHQSGRISSGIGLSLSKDLVEKHHGRIQVDSSEGSGTAFKVWLPADREHYTGDEILDHPEKDLTHEYISAMLETYEYTSENPHDAPLVGEALFRVLVIEDNIDMQKFLYNELAGSYNVILAEDGVQGMKLAREHLPDLIVSDVMMPRMDGLEFCRQLKSEELTSHVPVILLTAKSDDEAQVSGFEMGADDYITKPFNPEVLKLKIRNILISRKQLSEKFASDAGYIPENIKISQIDQGFLEKIVKLVEDNIDDTELSGNMLACELGMSKGNLYKKLKTLTGMTVNIFIRTIRLKVAARLLKQGNYNISEVAYAVGFNNPKYFSTCFSEMFSVSPKEYMR